MEEDMKKRLGTLFESFKIERETKIEKAGERASFVALFDILGFSELVRTSKLPAVAKMYRSAVRSFRQMLKNVPLRLRPRFVLFFSDTFLICTDGVTPKDFKVILYACDSLFLAATKNRLKIRGAVTIGHVISSGNILIGKPIVEAYARELDQDWMGCWITKRCIEAIPKKEVKALIHGHDIFRYKIPLKSGKISNQYAFNWLKSVERDLIDKNKPKLVPVEEIRRTVAYLENEKPLTWDAKRKLDNAKLFYEHALKFPEVSI